MNKSVALRVRMTEQEAATCHAAMARLQLTEISTFVRWALANSCAQVLGTAATGAAKPKVAPKPKPAPVPAAKPAEPSLSALLGVPLYSHDSGVARPAEVVEDDSWA
jgi:hypothetical protein